MNLVYLLSIIQISRTFNPVYLWQLNKTTSTCTPGTMLLHLTLAFPPLHRKAEAVLDNCTPAG